MDFFKLHDLDQFIAMVSLFNRLMMHCIVQAIVLYCLIFSRGQTILHLAMSVGRSVRLSVCWSIHHILIVDTQLYKRLCSSVSSSVRRSVRGHRVEKWKNKRYRDFLWLSECWGWVGVWMGVGCPCPPVRNNIVTPRHLFFLFPFWRKRW